LNNIWYRIKNKVNIQFIKHSWLNMKRDKTKAIFAIGGIMVSIILLTAMGMINDTMSYNYMELITNTTGSADIMISRNIKTDITFDPFFNENLINDNLQNIKGVEALFPRIMMPVRAFSDKSTENSTLQLYGLNFVKENENGNMGNLKIVNEEGVATGEVYRNEPENDQCVIFYRVAEILNVSVGDTLHLQYQQYELDLEIVVLCVQDLKFTEIENALIIVNLAQAQEFLQREGEINLIMGTVENPQSIYDVRSLDNTERKLRTIGTRIQQRLDPNEYSVSLPKLEELSSEEFLLIGMTIIFWFIIIIAVLITGILINSILSTSTEERIREYGIIRVVGGKKNFPLKMVIFEGLLIGVVGSIIGIIIGIFATPPIVNTLFIITDFRLQNVPYVIQPSTIILAFCIGSGVSFVISLFPALKTGKLEIIKSITPFHKKEEGWEVKKEGSVNIKSFLIGIAISTIGMVVFILLPNVVVTGDFMIIAGLFIGLLGAILIGMVFASVGIIPLIQTILIRIISPTIRKYANIIKISLKRNRRRNTSTIVMFAISFSFIFFITSVLDMESKNMSLNLKFQYGSELVLVNQGLGVNNDAITYEIVQDLKTMQNIDSCAISLYNMFDITSILSLFYDFSEGGGAFDQESINEAFTNIFEFYTAQAEEKYQTKAGDIANFDEFEVGFIGIEENYYNLIDENLFIWSSPNSGFNYSFGQLFHYNNTCIIANSLATVLGIQDVGEYIRLTFYNPKTPNDPGNISIFRVVGISGGMPGYYNFRSSVSSVSGAGIMVSLDNYMNLMDIEDPRGPDMIIDKVFINILDESQESIKDIKEEFQTKYNDKNFVIDDALSKINFMQDMYERQSTLLEVINWFAIAIAIFGLISTMYAVMLERKFEIGILRALGMKVKNVRNLFLIESLVILLSSGTMGTFIGTYSAYLLETNLGFITEMPIVFSVPFEVLARVFIISIVIGIIGMFIILRKLSKQTIMDTFRETF
jgi:ABC-type antimicrobial peptide transport system permease subunit